MAGKPSRDGRFQPSAISHQPSAISYQLSAISDSAIVDSQPDRELAGLVLNWPV
jgi:hypothetical protein